MQLAHPAAPDGLLPFPGCSNNRLMVVFYWVMGVLIVCTLLPSVLFMLLYAFSGDLQHATRARRLWQFSKLFTMLGINLLIWGHVMVGLWGIWFG
jgi:hypothetical protein